MKIEELSTYQSDIIKFFKSAKESHKLVHAYLFEGLDGSGTYEMAKYFAMMILCKEDMPCLKCNTCERIEYNSHISVITIEPEDGMIKKSQIEYFMKDFSKTSLEGSEMIYIIKEAEKMNSSSANALLKILEEPAENHYCILITENANALIDTIVSRCQVLRFNAPNARYLEKTLVEENIDKDFAYVISNISTAIDINLLKDDNKYYDIYKLAEKIVLCMLKNNDGYTEYFLGKEKVVEKEDHKLFLNTLIIIIKELLNNKYQENAYFENIKKNVKMNKIKEEKLVRYLEVLLEYLSRLDYPVNLNLFYAALFSKLQEE